MQWQYFPFKNHEDSLYWESKVLMLKLAGLWLSVSKLQLLCHWLMVTSEVLPYWNNKNVSEDALYYMHAMKLFIFDASILR